MSGDTTGESARIRGFELLAVCNESLAKAGAAEAEVFAKSSSRGAARFAIGELGQHMQLDEPLVLVRVAKGTRVGQARTTDLRVEGIVRAIRDAEAVAALTPEDPDFSGFHDGNDATLDPPRWSERTARATAEDRVERVARVLDRVRGAGLIGAGMLETRTTATSVATTRGCARSHDGTTASFKVWALETAGAGGAAGHGADLHRDLDALAIDRETERAVERALRGKNPTSVEPGAWDVVMEPHAVAELLEWLATIAFGASEIEQATSPVAGRAGTRVSGSHISIDEDPLDASALGFGTPFDREGVARRPVSLIDRGIAAGVLYDRAHAARAKAVSTGSAVSLDLGDANVGATSIHLAAGDAADVDDLIRGMKRGLYVCRLHYVNGYVQTRRATMTGLTRDGCFLVENGQIARAVTNLRFKDGFLDMLARADGMTSERRAVPTWWSDAGATVAPAVRMRGVHFTGGA